MRKRALDFAHDVTDGGVLAYRSVWTVWIDRSADHATASELDGREDPDVAAALQEMLRDEGIVIHLGAKVLDVQG